MNQIWVSRELESGAQSSEPMLKKKKKRNCWCFTLNGHTCCYLGLSLL